MAEHSKPSKAVEVFFAYTHEDEDLRDELSKHLAMLKRQRVITDWHDRRIGAGKERKKEIDEHLNSADIILLLVSSDFLASDYCYDVEVKTAMKRHQEGEARVIPVILRPVDWSGAPFGKLQALPNDVRPVTERPNRDEAFRNVAQGIRAEAEEQALPNDVRPVTEWPNRDEAFRNVAQGIRAEAEELAVNQIKRSFGSLAKVESLKNWSNVVSLGERILKSLPDHLPEYQTVRVKTAAAYVKRWSRCLDDRVIELWGCVQIKTKRNEDPEKIRDQILADLNRAIELDPENGEYYYLRYALRRLEIDFGYEGEIELGNLPYTRESVRARESDLARAIKLDPSIDEALRDLRRASDSGYGGITSISSDFDWKEFLDNPPKPMKIKEPWRLKCLRD